MGKSIGRRFGEFEAVWKSAAFQRAQHQFCLAFALLFFFFLVGFWGVKTM
jgi:hypothetical protein